MSTNKHASVNLNTFAKCLKYRKGDALGSPELNCEEKKQDIQYKVVNNNGISYSAIGLFQTGTNFRDSACLILLAYLFPLCALS